MIAKSDMLNVIDVASPCSASWDKMTGDDQVRHCDSCRLNVYNLSNMTKEEAEDLIIAKEGRLCVRFYRRTDGTLITRDCPVGLRALRLRLVRALAGTAALLAFMLVGVWTSRSGMASSGRNTNGPFSKFVEWITPPQLTQQPLPPVMGKVCPPAVMGELMMPVPQSPPNLTLEDEPGGEVEFQNPEIE